MLLYGKKDVRTWVIIVLFSVFVWAAIMLPYKINSTQQEPKYRVIYNEITKKYRAERWWRYKPSGPYTWTIWTLQETVIDHDTLAEAEEVIAKHRQGIESERNINDSWRTIKELF